MPNSKICGYANMLSSYINKSPVKQKHTAVAIRNGKIISNIGINHFRTHVFNRYGNTIHAEVDAIRNIVNRFCKKKYCILCS